jgi:hypothetical protein
MRTFPRAILHAPRQYGGFQIPDLYVEQGIAHIQRLIRYSQSRTHSTGILIRHSCEAFKVAMGCKGFIFSLPMILEPLATPSWVTHTWKFLHEYKISINDDLPDFTPPRENDSLLIPLFVKNGYSGKELCYLNQCRLYLQVTWLSELATGDGTKLEVHATKPPYQITCWRSILYPNQGPPSTDAWKTWTRALSDLCHPHGLCLKQKLGAWVSPSSIMWWFDQTTSRLYQRKDNSIREFAIDRPNRTRSSISKFAFIGTADTIPPSMPATARETTTGAILTGVGDFGQGIIRTEDELGWLKQLLKVPDNFQQSFQTCSNIIAVSDGSFKQEHGTAAWIVHLSELCEISGEMVTPGMKTDQSAYRSELAGIYGIACTIWLLEKEYGAIGKVTAACDGISALRQVAKPFDFIDPNLPQYDLILATRNIIRKTTWEWSWVHVKGHQDDLTPLGQLDIFGQLNVKMDAKAKEHWTRTVGTTNQSRLLGEPWPLYVGGIKVTSNLRDRVREGCLSPNALKYWSNKRQFRSAPVESIDWDAFGAALQASPSARQMWVTKMTTGFCATGAMMHRRRERNSAACPRCGQLETVEHVWKCDFDTSIIWNKAMDSLSAWLTENGTHPELQRQIILGLQQWRSNDPSTTSSTIPWIQTVIQKQQEFGWGAFFEGFVAKEWRYAQEKYLTRTKSLRSSRRWLSALIRKMWQIAWDLWEHRNGYLHNKEDNLISQELNKRLEQEFNKGTKLLRKSTRALFSGGLAALQRKPLEIRQQWLRRVTLARERDEEAARETFHTERQAMSRWLGTSRELEGDGY